MKKACETVANLPPNERAGNEYDEHAKHLHIVNQQQSQHIAGLEQRISALEAASDDMQAQIADLAEQVAHSATATAKMTPNKLPKTNPIPKIIPNQENYSMMIKALVQDKTIAGAKQNAKITSKSCPFVLKPAYDSDTIKRTGRMNDLETVMSQTVDAFDELRSAAIIDKRSFKKIIDTKGISINEDGLLRLKMAMRPHISNIVHEIMTTRDDSMEANASSGYFKSDDVEDITEEEKGKKRKATEKPLKDQKAKNQPNKPPPTPTKTPTISQRCPGSQTRTTTAAITRSNGLTAVENWRR